MSHSKTNKFPHSNLRIFLYKNRTGNTVNVSFLEREKVYMKSVEQISYVATVEVILSRT